MSDVMSQAEIDKLMSQANDTPKSSQLSSMEMDTLGEIGNISMGSAATALYEILDHKVTITTPDVKVTSLEELSRKHTVPYVAVNVRYTEGLVGNNLFVLNVDDVKLITNIMLGEEDSGSEEELNELHLSAISEVMNQMMGGVATSMAELFQLVVNISPPETKVVQLSDQTVVKFLEQEDQELIQISFHMEIEDLISSSIMQLMPIEFGRQVVRAVIPSEHEEEPIIEPPAAVEPPMPAKAPPPPGVQEPVNVQQIQLTSFDEPDGQSSVSGLAIDMILDVPLKVTVELGQCRKTIQEILDLNIGSIVTLNRLAGEPVDVLVNDKRIARGEVIVIDENYGIRVTEMVPLQNRVKLTQS